MEYTKGDWKAIKVSDNPDDWEWKVMSIEERLPLTIAEKLNKTNAQLIASAPDLYEALKRIFERADRGLPLDRTVHLIPAGKALAKAEGK